MVIRASTGDIFSTENWCNNSDGGKTKIVLETPVLFPHSAFHKYDMNCPEIEPVLEL